MRLHLCFESAIILVIGAALGAGCVHGRDNLAELQLGMSPERVEATIGQPRERLPQNDLDPSLSHWLYEFPESTGREVKVYALEFKDGRLFRYGSATKLFGDDWTQRYWQSEAHKSPLRRKEQSQQK